MPPGRKKKDLTEVKARLVALITELSRPATSTKDEDLAERLNVPVPDVKRALTELVAEARVLRTLSTKRSGEGYIRSRILHVHPAQPGGTKQQAGPRPGFGRPVYTCPVCREPLPG